MKGRGEIITILCLSVFLICILYAMQSGGIVKDEDLEKKTEKAMHACAAFPKGKSGSV